MELSVIIVNYNVRHFLENSLNSIKKSIGKIDAEIFVVDNASDDNSVEMLKEKFPDVHIIANQTNLGFAAANNIALAQSTGKFLALINPDSVIQEDTFTSLIGFLERDKNAGMVGCKILNPDGTLQLACRRSFPTPWTALTKVIGLASLFPSSRIFGKYNLTYRNPDQSYEVDAISGSFMFLRRDVYKQVGNLDESYFMYGEDLDWCYRIQKAGWKIYYYPETQIIHYKGESTRRSNVDEIKMFYNAMHIFVRTHLSHSFTITLILRSAIFLKWIAAWFTNIVRISLLPITDWLLIVASLLCAFYIRFNNIPKIPAYAILPIIIVPGFIIVATIFYFDGYNKYKHSISRAGLSIILGFTIISALTFFFKQFAFSRIVVGYATVISILLLTAIRLFFQVFNNLFKRTDGKLVSRTTLVVGIDENTGQILDKIKSNTNHNYQVIGLIDLTYKRIGENISGIPIIGSLANISKIIESHSVDDVIFLTNTVSYKNILSVIARYTGRHVNYRMVTNSLDVIIAKTRIDQLDDLPLIEIDYRLNKPFNRFGKRLFDIAGAVFLWLFFLPLKKAFKEKIHYNSLGNVISGKFSLVGNPIDSTDEKIATELPFKPGLTGLLQISRSKQTSTADRERYSLLYAKNYSLFLDIEILTKTIVNIFNKY
jgi:O-antigen biosynthesis protein